MLDSISLTAGSSSKRESISILMNLSRNSSSIQYKRTRKVSTDPLEESKRSFLASLLQVIIQKMKWDDEEDPHDLDEDDHAAFETLRKVVLHIPSDSSLGLTFLAGPPIIDGRCFHA